MLLRPIYTLFPYTTLFRSYGEYGREDYNQNLRDLLEEPDHIGGYSYMFGFRKVVGRPGESRSEEHTSELQSHSDLVCRLLLEKKTMYSLHLMSASTSSPTN